MARKLDKAVMAAGVMIAVLGAGSAMAQERAVRMSQTAIVGGELARAEKALVAERRIHPNRPEIMLNLAAVYARTGRPGMAGALYREILAGEDVLMDLASGKTASAHAIARTGMGKLTSDVATR